MVRTTSYGLPGYLHDHIELIQPTTMFATLKQQRSTIFKVGADAAIAQPNPNVPAINTGTGITVDASCNKTITISCLQQLYNAVGVIPSATVNNSVAVTGYLVRILLVNHLDLG